MMERLLLETLNVSYRVTCRQTVQRLRFFHKRRNKKADRPDSRSFYDKWVVQSLYCVRAKP